MSAQDPPSRGPLELLKNRMLGPFLAGKLLSSFGMWIQNISAAVLMYEVTESAFMVGLVSTFQFLPIMLFSLTTGALTDRLDRRRILMAGRLVSGTAILILGATLVFDIPVGIEISRALLFVVFTTGCGWALSNPAMQALLPSLVRKEDLEQALAMNAAVPSLARTIGPALGAGLLLVAGPGVAFLVSGVAHLSFVMILLNLQIGSRPKPTSRLRIFGGLSYLFQDHRAGLLVAAVAALGFGADPIVTLTPSLAAEMGSGTDAVGILASAFGLGAVLFTVLIRFLRQRFLSLRGSGILGFVLLGSGLIGVSVSPDLRMAVTGFFVAGSGYMMANVSLNTRIQKRVPDELRGRVMALWGLAFLGSRPIAALVNGSIADHFGVRRAFVAAALVTACSSMLARVSYRRPARD